MIQTDRRGWLLGQGQEDEAEEASWGFDGMSEGVEGAGAGDGLAERNPDWGAEGGRGFDLVSLAGLGEEGEAEGVSGDAWLREDGQGRWRFVGEKGLGFVTEDGEIEWTGAGVYDKGLEGDVGVIAGESDHGVRQNN